MNNMTETTAFFYTFLVALISALFMLYFIDLEAIQSMIYAHVGLGSLAFAIGGVTLFSKKGSPIHKLTGKVFYYSMVVSVAISWLVSVLPGHFSPTMFHIAVLSLYFLLVGKRSILFKKADHSLTIDKVLALFVIVISVAVMSYTFFVEGRVHPLRIVFGTIGIVFGSLDLWMFRDAAHVKRKWFFLHLSKMLGGYTAAVTAFFVAQKVLTGYFNWFLPTVIAVSYIIFWALKMKTFKPAISTTT